MSPRSKREYREAVHLRYKNASRHEKTIILDEFCATCGCHRKHAIRVLKRFKHFTRPKPKRRGKPPVYQNEAIINPLKEIWLAANLPCSKRLKVMVPIWLPGYGQLFEELSPDVSRALLNISHSTIDRILKPIRIHYTKRGRSTTKPGTLLRKKIPINTNQWDESRPGFLEADLVAHCGDSTQGMFANTLDLTDIATGWTEQRAVWGKGQTGVVDQIHHVETLLPFPLLGFDCDNGSEFLNDHLLRYFTNRKRPVQFTRSRAYHKDDNAHVEQKNWTHVRQWLFHNFFCPSVKLIEKERIGSKTITRHDSPKTPYQRIIDSPHIQEKVKLSLPKLLEKLNPFLLRKIMDKKMKKIFSINNKPG
jgi:hypothetical protein